MRKYSFNAAQRHAVFTVHGEKCYMCETPLDMSAMEVDHILPEELLDKPENLLEVLRTLGRSDDFQLNSYANWLPACRRCNGKKQASVFDSSPLIQLWLQRAAEKAHAAEELAAKTISNKKIHNALNTLERAFAKGTVEPSLIDAARSLFAYQMENRLADMVAEPVRLAPNYAVFLEIHFFGGCFDKRVFRSGGPELDVNKAKWFLLLVGGYIATSQQENKKPAYYLKWRQPVPEVVKLAKEQNWPKEKHDTDMRFHVYHVTDYEEIKTTVCFKAYYQGIE